MEQIDRMASSISSGGDDDRVAVGANNRQQGPAMITQDLPSQPILKCPRCDSSNTKFCYYNNYSQTQPRHFCKSCRRYWTQGGTLRNVPVGGGCRKNKRVRPRSLLSMGPGLDMGPTSFSDTTSNMLGNLSNMHNFSHGGGDPSSQLLNIAFSRFQESMRLRQQSAQSSEAGVHFSDMSLPALVQRPCGLSSCVGGTCTNPASHHHLDAAAGRLIGDSYEQNLGFTTLHAEAGYSNNNYEMPNPDVYAQDSKMHSMMGSTSATATLASIEDELSNFSNLQYYVNPFNADHGEQKGFDLLATGSGAAHRLLTTPLRLMEPHISYIESSLQMNNTDLPNHEQDEKPIKDDRVVMSAVNGENGLSLMMSADHNWAQQQQSSTSEMLYEPHHSMMWSTNAPRWQDMHAMATSTAAAGSVL